jgi:hypothetical protein
MHIQPHKRAWPSSTLRRRRQVDPIAARISYLKIACVGFRSAHTGRALRNRFHFYERSRNLFCLNQQDVYEQIECFRICSLTCQSVIHQAFIKMCQAIRASTVCCYSNRCDRSRLRHVTRESIACVAARLFGLLQVMMKLGTIFEMRQRGIGFRHTQENPDHQ